MGGKREEVGKPENIGYQQNDENEEQYADDAEDIAAGRQLVQFPGDLVRFIVGQRIDARFRFPDRHTLLLQLGEYVLTVNERVDPGAILPRQLMGNSLVC